MDAVDVAVAPERAGAGFGDAVRAGGGRIAEPAEAQALLWAVPDEAEQLDALLRTNPGIRWVQLPWAGVERQLDAVRAHPEVLWTCAKGLYAEPVAEMAVALLLAGFRGLGRYARATAWSRPRGRRLEGAKVVALGGGGITRSVIRVLAPFGPEVTVVRRRPEPVDGAARVVGADQLDEALDGADAAVLALALTPETAGILDRRRLELLAPGAWVVNVARGAHVVTDDLLAVLEEGHLGGAALDVTDPEPLPEGHPLWSQPDVIITPHVANTAEMAWPLLSRRITENLRRWAAGEPLEGVVDAALGY